MSSGRRGLADVILALEPEMRELVSLRREVVELRTKTTPPTPDVHALIKKTAIAVFQGQDGRWEARINLLNPETGAPVIGTGGSGFETDVDAFVFAVNRLAGLLAKAWNRDDEEA